MHAVKLQRAKQRQEGTCIRGLGVGGWGIDLSIVAGDLLKQKGAQCGGDVGGSGGGGRGWGEGGGGGQQAVAVVPALGFEAGTWVEKNVIRLRRRGRGVSHHVPLTLGRAYQWRAPVRRGRGGGLSGQGGVEC